MADKADKADTWRTRFGGAAKAQSRRTQGGHTADTRRTSSGDAARAYRGQPFFSKREPHSKQFWEMKDHKGFPVEIDVGTYLQLLVKWGEVAFNKT